MEEEEIIELVFVDVEKPVEHAKAEENDVDGDLELLEEELREEVEESVFLGVDGVVEVVFRNHVIESDDSFHLRISVEEKIPALLEQRNPVWSGLRWRRQRLLQFLNSFHFKL